MLHVEPFDAWNVRPPWVNSGDEIDWQGGRRPGIIVSGRPLLTAADPRAIVAPLTRTILHGAQFVEVRETDRSGLGAGTVKCDQLFGFQARETVFLRHRGNVAHLRSQLHNSVRMQFRSYATPGRGLDSGHIVSVALPDLTPCIVISSGRANDRHPLALITIVRTVPFEAGDRAGLRTFDLEDYTPLFGKRRIADVALIRTVPFSSVQGPPLGSLKPTDLAALIDRVHSILE